MRRENKKERVMQRLVRVVIGAAGLVGLSLFVSTAAAGGVAIEQGGGSQACVMTMRAAARSRGPEVVLGEVAELASERAKGLGSVVVGRFEGKSRTITVGVKDVEDALAGAGVWRAAVILRGAEKARVERVVKEASLAAVSGGGTGLASANPGGEVDLGVKVTLRDFIVAKIREQMGVKEGDELRIGFSSGDSRFLAGEVKGDRIEFDPQSRVELGRVPVVVRRHRGDEVVETRNVSVEVSRLYRAVVLTRGVGRGQVFLPGDLEVREVWLHNRGHPATDAQEVAGRVSKSLLRAGAVVMADQAQQPALVQRGDLVSVRCVSGAFVVRTVGRAVEDGAMDQVVQVRNEKSRRGYQVRVTGVKEGVLLSEDTSASAAGLTAGPVARLGRGVER